MKKRRSLTLSLVLLGSGSFLTGCDGTTPTTPAKSQVKTAIVTHDFEELPPPREIPQLLVKEEWDDLPGNPDPAPHIPEHHSFIPLFFPIGGRPVLLSSGTTHSSGLDSTTHSVPHTLGSITRGGFGSTGHGASSGIS